MYRISMRNIIAFMTCLLWAQAAYALSTVNVLATKSTSIALTQIAQNYSRDYGAIVNISFASPKAQQQQINEGGAADILITPVPQWIEELKAQGLVDIYSQTLLAKNRLALVGPLDSPIHVDLAQQFPVAQIIEQIEYEPGFLVANPETLQEGAFAMQALKNMQVFDYLEPYTLYPKQMDEMYQMVTANRAYGIFYYSSTVARPGIKVLDVFPENTHSPIAYYGVVIAGDNMDEARRFLTYLHSKAAQATFKKNGFFVD
ncbi:MAG: molybdate ABC transporter substrate-binding protein [Rickettsiales bacterium]|nr:molybdate ABC transporter substrate-binding protein [Rickettsiales bacterium]